MDQSGLEPATSMAENAPGIDELDEGAPRVHENAKRDDPRLPATAENRHGHVETRINRPPPHFNGKEGVDGSSPSEGSAKGPEIGSFTFASTCRSSNVGVPAAVRELQDAVAKLAEEIDHDRETK